MVSLSSSSPSWGNRTRITHIAFDPLRAVSDIVAAVHPTRLHPSSPLLAGECCGDLKSAFCGRRENACRDPEAAAVSSTVDAALFQGHAFPARPFHPPWYPPLSRLHAWLVTHSLAQSRAGRLANALLLRLRLGLSACTFPRSWTCAVLDGRMLTSPAASNAVQTACLILIPLGQSMPTQTTRPPLRTLMAPRRPMSSPCPTAARHR